jgi:putative hydrolase of the HAD superfamily
MSLLLLDLDDTLLDRTAAMRQWAWRFLGEVDAPQSDIEWLLNRDAGAPLPLEEFAGEIQQHYTQLSERLQRAAVSDVPEDRMYM